MPDRILRDELLQSERWLQLARNTHRLAFVCLIPAADALGNMEASDGRLWRLWRDPLRLDERVAIAEILEALVAADLIRLYEVEGKRYLHVPRSRQRLRYLGRLFPPSPWTTTEEKQRLDISFTGSTPDRHRARTGLSPAEVKRSEVEVKRSEEKKPVEVKGRSGGGTRRTPAVGSRLPPDWRLPEDWKNWALLIRKDWTPQGIVRESLTFRDYWLAKSGKDATKVDWLATWRNWIRRAEHEPTR